MLTRTKFDNATNAHRSLQEEVIQNIHCIFPERLSTFILKLHRCDDTISYDTTNIDELCKKIGQSIFSKTLKIIVWGQK